MASTKLKLCSWNINGIRAVAKKGFFDWLDTSGFDFVGVQEIKAQPDQLDDSFTNISKYPEVEYNSAERKGYSGTAGYYKKNFSPTELRFGFDIDRFKDIKLPPEITSLEQGKKETTMSRGKALKKTTLKDQVLSFNSEGRVIESVHDLDSKNKLVLFNVYFPNGGASTERLQFKLEFYEAFWVYLKKTLEITPYVVVTGDYNTAHHEIDLARPKENTNTSGFMPIERDYLDDLEDLGFVDSFRQLNPEKAESYTWWSFRTAARKRNIGWRIDYFYISSALVPYLKKAQIHSDVEGSDHCPVSIELNF